MPAHVGRNVPSVPEDVTMDAEARRSPLHETLYLTAEIAVSIFAVCGNALVVAAFARERRIRRCPTVYILSLSVADLLVGAVGIPSAIMVSQGQPRNTCACLGLLTVLLVLCTTSTFNLVAVSIDKYWAILYPIHYFKAIKTYDAGG